MNFIGFVGLVFVLILGFILLGIPTMIIVIIFGLVGGYIFYLLRRKYDSKKMKLDVAKEIMEQRGTKFYIHGLEVDLKEAVKNPVKYEEKFKKIEEIEVKDVEEKRKRLEELEKQRYEKMLVNPSSPVKKDKEKKQKKKTKKKKK